VNEAQGQSQYQVRFEWGVAGAQAIASDVDVIVLVDALPGVPDRSLAATMPGGSTVVTGDLRSRDALAEWVLARQDAKGDRFTVALIAAGGQWADGSMRLAIEDQLAAGAIISALADVGIDYCSPEAAVAAASYTGLRGAIGHLITASASGRELAAADQSELVRTAVRGDPTPVTVLREFGQHS
jgi:phosphosulfolactate phosphohydrolase-like enzyme